MLSSTRVVQKMVGQAGKTARESVVSARLLSEDERVVIGDLMKAGCSIRNILRVSFPGMPEMHGVHETIYRDLYDYRGGALSREYCRSLRTGRNRRKTNRMIPKRRSRFAG